MNKIKQEFADLITAGEKTIELRKSLFLKDCSIRGEGSIEIPFQIIGKNEFIIITFNGYQIIKKDDFNDYIEYVDECLNDSEDFDFDCDVVSEYWLCEFEEDSSIRFPIWFLKNIKWIWDNLEFINKYYEKETEIMVLFIKKFEVVKET